MNYQPLILTCDCGYRTPTVGRNGHPLTQRRAKDALRRHKCASTPPHTATCTTCGDQWPVLNPQQGTRCRSCASREALTARNADLDEIAVERLLSGSMVNTTRAERQAATAYLTRHGLSALEIARRIRVTQRTVQRLRARVAA